MRAPRVSSFARTLIAMGLALALPTLLVIALSVYFSLQREREDIEDTALGRAEQVSSLNDAKVEADLAVMRVLAGSPSLFNRDWEMFRERAADAVRLNPSWKTVIISDLDSGEKLFDLAAPFNDQTGPLPPALTNPALFRGEGAGGVRRDGGPCPCVYLNLRARSTDADRIMMTVAIDPQDFQSILERLTPPDLIAATVDREGDFIARIPAYEERVGTPATEYVQEAVKRGGSGLYSGQTYEGVNNLTAYYTSPVTGWSVHFAVRNSVLQRSSLWSNWVVLGGGLGGDRGRRRGHRLRPVQPGGAPARGRTAAPGPEAGGAGPAHRRGGARLQQPSHRDYRRTGHAVAQAEGRAHQTLGRQRL